MSRLKRNESWNIALKYEKVGRFKISMPCCLLTVFKFSKNDFPFFKKIKRKNTYDNKKLFFIFKKLEYLHLTSFSYFFIIFKNILKHDYINIHIFKNKILDIKIIYKTYFKILKIF